MLFTVMIVEKAAPRSNSIARKPQANNVRRQYYLCACDNDEAAARSSSTRTVHLYKDYIPTTKTQGLRRGVAVRVVWHHVLGVADLIYSARLSRERRNRRYDDHSLGSTSSDGGAVDPAAGVCGGGGHAAAAVEERIINDVPDDVQALTAGTRHVATSTTPQQPHIAHSDCLVATVQGGDQPRLVATRCWVGQPQG
eukprot:3222052-Pyramimonas_sp.AAC.1